jgi:putative hydrolase of the HAD superfamily
LTTLPKKIHAVILDYGLVLCQPPAHACVDRIASQFGLSRDEFWRSFEKIRPDYDSGALSSEQYWAMFAKDAGIDPTTVDVASLRQWDIEMWSDMNLKMLDCVRSMRAAGWRTAILSNMHADFATHLRRTATWLAGFDSLVFSSEVGMVKPDLAIYRYCVRQLGVPAEEAIFIDDRVINVRAAASVGLNAILFRSTEELMRDLGVFGCAHLESPR